MKVSQPNQQAFYLYCSYCLGMESVKLTSVQEEALKNAKKKTDEMLEKIRGFDKETRAYFGISGEQIILPPKNFMQLLLLKNDYEQKRLAYPRLSDVEKRDVYEALKTSYDAFCNTVGFFPKYFTDFLAKYPLPSKPQESKPSAGTPEERLSAKNKKPNTDAVAESVPMKPAEDTPSKETEAVISEAVVEPPKPELPERIYEIPADQCYVVWDGVCLRDERGELVENCPPPEDYTADEHVAVITVGQLNDLVYAYEREEDKAKKKWYSKKKEIDLSFLKKQGFAAPSATKLIVLVGGRWDKHSHAVGVRTDSKGGDKNELCVIADYLSPIAKFMLSRYGV